MRHLTIKIGTAALICFCLGMNAPRLKGVTASPRASRQAADSKRENVSGVAAPALQRRDARYRLYPSDEIAIAFPLTPEFNQNVTIEPDGYASLTAAGEVRLAGLTTDEAIAAIKTAYAKVLHDPIITVQLKGFNKPFFVVTGQVNRPGKYDLRGPTSATEAVAIAGGMTGAAKASDALLFRRADGTQYEVARINLKRIFNGQQPEGTELMPGDMLYIPKNVISKIERFIPSSGFGAYYQLQP